MCNRCQIGEEWVKKSVEIVKYIQHVRRDKYSK